MRLILVTLAFMITLAIATCLAMTLTAVAVEHHAPHAFIIIMSGFTALTAFMTVTLPIAFHRAHSS